VAQPGTSDDLRLIAYVVREAGDQDLLEGLRAQPAKKKLPEYMMPVAFVSLKAMPLTLNGKWIAKRCRLLMERDRNSASRSGRARYIRDSAQRESGSLLLGLYLSGIKDDFFELAANRCWRKALHSSLPVLLASITLSTLFQAGTIERLSQVLRRSSAAVGVVIGCINNAGIKGRCTVCIPVATRLYLLAARAEVRNGQPVYGLQARGVEGQGPLHRVFGMAAHYVAEIRRFNRGPYHLLGDTLGGLFAF